MTFTPDQIPGALEKLREAQSKYYGTHPQYDGDIMAKNAAVIVKEAIPIIEAQQARIVELEGALKLAAVRLEILTGRARACHEVTGMHELMDEAEMFCQEAKQALRQPEQQKEQADAD